MKVLVFLCFCSTLIFDSFCQKAHYISTSGNDLNSGLSPTSPWRTLKEVKRGNTYLFRRGDKFFLNINPLSDSTGSKTTIISSYGVGPNPVISLFNVVDGSNCSKDGDQIYVVNLASKSCRGFKGAKRNVGFIKVDGTIYGAKKYELSELTQDWDFYSEDSLLYIYSSLKSLDTKKIEVACDIPAIRLVDKMIISGIDIVGTGSHGITGSNNTEIVIRNVGISQIGGSNLTNFGNKKVRYGNGIEFFNGCKNCVVEKCKISQVYDAAITMQGDFSKIHFVNVVIKDNIFENNEQSFEVWIRGGGPGFTNCKFVSNMCFNAGYGWSHKYRPAKYEGVHLLFYELDCRSYNLVIEKNTFRRARSGLYFFLNKPNTPKFISRNNRIYLANNTPIRSISNFIKDDTLHISRSRKFVDLTGLEQRSTFKTVSEQ